MATFLITVYRYTGFTRPGWTYLFIVFWRWDLQLATLVIDALFLHFFVFSLRLSFLSWWSCSFFFCCSSPFSVAPFSSSVAPPSFSLALLSSFVAPLSSFVAPLSSLLSFSVAPLSFSVLPPSFSVAPPSAFSSHHLQHLVKCINHLLSVLLHKN